MFSNDLLSIFGARESNLISAHRTDEVQAAWNELLDAKDVLELNYRMYGDPSYKELISVYRQITLQLKEASNGYSTKKDKSP